MPKRIPKEELKAIEDAVRGHPAGVTLQQISDELKTSPARRTLQYRLKYLVDARRLVVEGAGRWTKYRLPPTEKRSETVTGKARLEQEADLSLPMR